ncbi:hypothetical protein [Streptomyces carminius]|nr:hypothetical protein [Streptomyces carminius]
MPRPRLNERQLNVLRRICHGPQVTSADSDLAVTVYALRHRKLVTTTWANGRWTAAATDAGRQYLAENDTTNPHPAAPGAASPRASDSTGNDAAHLITTIRQADGTLHITDPSAAERARLRRLLHAARAEHLVPDGHHLQYTGRDKGDMIITLRPGPTPARDTPQTAPIAVPADLLTTRLHPAARDTPLPVCPNCRSRARRILHALCLAAQQQGHTAGAPASTSSASLVITAGEHTFPLSFTEGSHEVPDTEGIKYSWQRVTARTTHPSHQLELSLEHSYAHPGRRYRWGDRQRWRLEDKLPDVLREVAHRARIEHERQLARQRAENETRQRWLAAMEQARTDFIEAHRLKTLRAQVHAWQEATAIRDYCQALEEHQPGTATPETVAQWIAWARAYAKSIDPLPHNPGLPPDPDITPQDLRPYLHGWSPYEPKQR